MRNNTAELIQRILEGDDAAFTCLVRKYQKRVHALAWRKVGDFHIAEDITQETFLQVYRNLANAEGPKPVSGMALCDCQPPLPGKWLRKKRSPNATLGGDRYSNDREVILIRDMSLQSRQKVQRKQNENSLKTYWRS